MDGSTPAHPLITEDELNALNRAIRANEAHRDRILAADPFDYSSDFPDGDAELLTALRGRLLAIAPAHPEPVAVVTECEACFTPDVCQLRGTCDHYSAEQLRIAKAAPAPAAPAEQPAQLTEEQVARLFHETYERLAPEFGYETRPETREFRPDSANGRLMIAVCGEVLRRIGR